MKSFPRSRTVASFVCLFSTLVLTGCDGFEGTSFPTVNPQNHPGSIQGGVFGGHAPIVGARVFVMEALSAGTAPSGYAAAASSKITSSTGTLDGTTGNYFVTTDVTGTFNITGDYSCDVGQPVYLYAQSGASSSATGTTAIAVTQATATPAAATGGTTYTIQFTGTNSLVVGQQVFLTVSSSADADYATYLNSTYQNVTAATGTAFTIQYSNAAASHFGTSGTTAHTDTVTGTGTPGGTNNPGIVNLAMLGKCPSSGNFSTGATAISYVYLNEVSTVATAYAMAGFGTDGLHIGSSANGLTGLQNGALNANNLYNIQNNVGAQMTSVGGNGTVPQAELNTLGNILAACVDSANTSANASSACTTLFNAATSTGATGGKAPTDIATAAFNIAHNPGTANVVGLWNSAGTNTPFGPTLTAKPNDFTVAITYPVTAPAGLAIDAAGDVYAATNSTTAGYVTKLSPQGAVSNTSATGGTGMTSVAIDATGNVWASAKTSNALYKYTSALGPVTGSPYTNAAMANPNEIGIDTSGDVYVAQTTSGNVGSLVEFSNAGALLYNVDTNSNAAYATAIALDKVGAATDVWLVSNQNNDVTLFGNPSGGSSTVGTGSGFSTPTGIAVDSSGNAWATNSQSNRPLYKLATNGTTTYWGVDSTGNNPVGGLSAPKWVAIDGSENVWVTNATGSSVSEISGATSTLAYSPSTGYQAGNVTGAGAIEVDGSGDVWIADQTGNSVMQIVGVATPVTTPLSAQKPGVQP